MALLTDTWLFDIVTILTSLVTILLAFCAWSHTYWKRRGIYTPPTNLLFGNLRKVLFQQNSFGDFTLEVYNDVKNKRKQHGGIFFLYEAIYLPIDPELIKQIMQNDFQHFMDRGIYVNEKGDPLSAHLFSLKGVPWKNLRAKLTPTFTSGKMKMMFETLVNCGDQLNSVMDKNVKTSEAVNIKDILVRFTIDIIGNCAFGIDCNSLANPNAEFITQCNTFFNKDFWENIRDFFTVLAPTLAQKLNVAAVNPKLSEFFMRVVKDTVDYREKNNIHRKDFMHLLLQLKNKGRLDDESGILGDKTDNVSDVKLTLNQLAAKAFVFFLAGFETSSTTMTFCLFELATNPEIQEKLRKEVNEVLKKHDNKLTYDAIMEMHYMEKVINETLRKYPPLPILNRIVTKTYNVPGTDLVLEKGTQVMIPILGLQRDEDYYPDPMKFNPERFSEENKRIRHPYTYLPFGEEPRICIGLRFGMMQTKVGLSVLLKNYRFTLNNKTQVPLKMDPKSFIMATEGGIWLNYEKV